MKVLKIIAKAALAIAAVRAMGISDSSGNPDIFGAIMMFAVIYGLLSWYIYAFTHGSPIFVGGGLIAMAFAMIINLGLPLLVIVAPLFILEAILPGQIGTIIYGIVLSAACLGCIALDVTHVVRLFKPDFLGGAKDFAEAGEDTAAAE